ncbi:hypothetical protein ACH5RR_039270 [Cinchona calisaya]|uniref:Small ribosomal subunit protein uS7 domain-containing protein n=1 Tax=Cinchona calisaya TaxID=153742 RepID=A0ABD2Y2W9_9GENT
MEGFPLYGGDGCGPSSSKGPHIDLNLPPRPEPEQEPPETSPEEEERRKDWEELRASKGHAREIAQERGFSPEKCDVVEDVAEYIADDVHNQEGAKQLHFLAMVGLRTPWSKARWKQGSWLIKMDTRTERDVIKLMVNTLENIKPICEVEKVGIAGTIYDVPGIVARDRQQTLAIRWILEAAFKRRISYRISLEKSSFAEILDAYRKRGIACKKRENLHGLASTYRSFAHFRWW